MEGCIKGDIFQNSGRGFFREKNQCISLSSTQKHIAVVGKLFWPISDFLFQSHDISTSFFKTVYYL